MRKILDSFTATHVTALVIAALFVPGAIFAADAFTRVVIQDTAGHQAAVVGGKLETYDPVADPLAGYARDPKNAVSIEFSLFSSQGCQSTTYPIPSGKALVLTSASGGHDIVSGQTTTQQYLYDQPSCEGNLLDYVVGTQSDQSINESFGNGLVVPAGKTLTVYSEDDVGYLYLHGYLVSATAAPSSAEAAYQGRPITAQEVRAKQASRGRH